MKQNILIELYVPALFRSFDIYLSDDLKVYEATRLIGQVIADMSHGQYSIGEQSVLCMRTSGDILDINLSVRKLKLVNGDQLMLI